MPSMKRICSTVDWRRRRSRLWLSLRGSAGRRALASERRSLGRAPGPRPWSRVRSRPGAPPGGGFGAPAAAPQCFGQAPQGRRAATASRPPRTPVHDSAAANGPGTTTAAPADASPASGGEPPRGRARGPVAAARVAEVDAAGGAPLNFNDQTLRQIVHTSLGGDRVRVVLSNAFGTSPLAVGAAHVALREKDAAIVVKSDRALTFGGSPSVNIPPGAVVVSDPVALTVPAFADLAIDLYLPGDTAASTVAADDARRRAADQLRVGDRQSCRRGRPAGRDDDGGVVLPVARRGGGAASRPARSSRSAIRLPTAPDRRPNTNNRWPDQLAKRLQAQKINLGVLNQGIAGNRVLGDGAGVSALARFDRDVLAQAARRT